MAELITALSAARWYGRHGHEQYTGADLSTYDHAADVLTRRREYAKHILGEIGDDPGKTLEVAAGTGLISERVSKQIPDAIYTDYAGAALDVLKYRIDSGVALQASFYELPFGEKTFDTVFTVGGYRYVDPEEKNSFWAEMNRVLNDDGRLIVGQFYPRGKTLNGSDITSDLPEIPPYFTLERTSDYKAIVGSNLLKLRSGTYNST